MAFWGHKFIFNEIPCETFDLMMYDIGGESQGDGKFAHMVTIVEEIVGTRWKPYFYGIKYDKKQEFDIVFGVNQDRIDKHQYLDRYELAEISAWLAGHPKYLWLEIEQDDMTYFRYRCIITSLDIVSYGNIPWALKATVTCDGPYAYLYPQEFKYDVNGEIELQFYNESSHNGYYKPEMQIEISSGSSFSIVNETDSQHAVQFTGLPTSIRNIYVNNDTEVITTPSGENVYEYCNFQFLRLKRGYNTLKVTGHGTLTLRCEFPISTGG